MAADSRNTLSGAPCPASALRQAAIRSRRARRRRLSWRRRGFAAASRVGLAMMIASHYDDIAMTSAGQRAIFGFHGGQSIGLQHRCREHGGLAAEVASTHADARRLTRRESDWVIGPWRATLRDAARRSSAQAPREIDFTAPRCQSPLLARIKQRRHLPARFLANAWHNTARHYLLLAGADGRASAAIAACA